MKCSLKLKHDKNFSRHIGQIRDWWDCKYITTSIHKRKHLEIHKILRHREKSITCLKRLINLEIEHDTNNRSHSRSNRNQKAAHAHGLHTNPLHTPLWYLLLNNIHLHWKIHCQGPELQRPDDPDDVIEERKQHRHDGGEADEEGSPYESEHVDVV